jgi:DNA-directed RNA polymerase specialized sigma54-like protein
MPSRLVKRQLVKRILKDTEAVRSGSLVNRLRKQGYDQVPLDELQDRLSKLPTSLADFILKGRG